MIEPTQAAEAAEGTMPPAAPEEAGADAAQAEVAAAAAAEYAEACPCSSRPPATPG